MAICVLRTQPRSKKAGWLREEVEAGRDAVTHLVLRAQLNNLANGPGLGIYRECRAVRGDLGDLGFNGD